MDVTTVVSIKPIESALTERDFDISCGQPGNGGEKTDLTWTTAYHSAVNWPHCKCASLLWTEHSSKSQQEAPIVPSRWRHKVYITHSVNQMKNLEKVSSKDRYRFFSNWEKNFAWLKVNIQDAPHQESKSQMPRQQDSSELADTISRN